MEPQFEPYTCLMSVYEQTNEEQLVVSIDSILAQTVLPNEFLIVIDGAIPENLNRRLEEYGRNNPSLFKFIRFETKCGLPAAMREGVLRSSNSLIMRMDADDYSRFDRAERQLRVFADDPNLQLVGSDAYEFIDSPEKVVARVRLPEHNEEIVRYARRRNPFRHDAVIFRKEAVLSVGNYEDVPFFEDYDLFIRMLGKGCKAYNVQEPLISVRVSEDFYMRRGGISYLKNTVFFLKKCWRDNLLTTFDCAVTIVPRAVVCIIPNKLRGVVYRHLLRSDRDNSRSG